MNTTIGPDPTVPLLSTFLKGYSYHTSHPNSSKIASALYSFLNKSKSLKKIK